MRATIATLGVLLGLSLGSPAWALDGSLPANQEVPEMMMELQGQIFTWLGTSFGPSEAMSFTSTTDISNKTFSFNSDSGSTYAGQSASISGAGTFNTSTNEWDFSASGSVLGESWSLSGTAVDPPMHYDLDLDLLLLNPQRVVASVDFNINGNLLVSLGVTEVRNTITDALISRALYADARVLDGPNKGSWNWSTGNIARPNGNVSISTSGYSPDEGGAGNFTVTVVPEPTSFVLLAAGASAMLIWRRRDRRRRGQQACRAR